MPSVSPTQLQGVNHDTRSYLGHSSLNRVHSRLFGWPGINPLERVAVINSEKLYAQSKKTLQMLEASALTCDLQKELLDRGVPPERVTSVVNTRNAIMAEIRRVISEYESRRVQDDIKRTSE